MAAAASTTITVKVLFFAAAREMAGTGGADVELAGPDAHTTAELRARIAELYPGTAGVVPSITLALNQEVGATNGVGFGPPPCRWSPRRAEALRASSPPPPLHRCPHSVFGEWRGGRLERR